MNKLSFVVIASVLLVASVRSSPQDTTPNRVTPTAAPADVESIDSIIAALYDVISGSAGQKRDWDRMRSLFTSDASMGVVVIGQKADVRHFDLSVERYISLSDPALQKVGFFEREVGRKGEKFAHIAQVFSTYESRHEPKEKPFERGINSIQLLNDGKRWWIRSILWEGETLGFKLPKQFLKKNRV